MTRITSNCRSVFCLLFFFFFLSRVTFKKNNIKSCKDVLIASRIFSLTNSGKEFKFCLQSVQLTAILFCEHEPRNCPSIIPPLLSKQWMLVSRRNRSVSSLVMATSVFYLRRRDCKCEKRSQAALVKETGKLKSPASNVPQDLAVECL